MKNHYKFSLTLTSIFFILPLCFFSLSTFAKDEFLTLGILPYVTSSKLIKHQGKLIHYLEQQTGYKISMVTAPNFKSFIQRSNKSEYDLILTAPHHGRYLELKNMYQPIAMTQTKIQAYYVVLKNSPFQSLSDIKGKKIAIMPPVTMLTQVVYEQLAQHDIKLSELEIIPTKTYNNAIYSVINHDSDVSVTGIKLFQRLKSSDKKKLRILDKSKEIPGFFLMASKDIEPSQVKKIQEAVIQFKNKKYIFKGFESINKNISQNLDEYTHVFKQF
jgi:phosphonate transport system substrate-binding protein